MPSVPSSKLAIDGGAPAVTSCPAQWPVADDDVRQALLQAYDDGSWGQYHGGHCQRLADRLAEFLAVQYVSLCSSGTVAVELALRGLGIAAGDEVILAAYDFPGNFRAVEAIAARPVLVDIDPRNWSLDPGRVDAAISNRTKAIVVSHLHGGMAPMRQFVALAKKHSLWIVEDACQVPGAVVDGRQAGAWGDVGVWSFGGSKLLTAGRGGAVWTADAAVHQRIRVYAERGNSAVPLSELQAAVLLPQLEKLAARNKRRAAAVQRLLDTTRHLESLVPLVNHTAGRSSYYKVAWRFECGPGVEVTRDRFLAAVQAEGVAMDAGFRGFTRRSPRRCRKVGTLPHSERAASQTVLLHHPVLLESEETLDQVAHALVKVATALAS